jgi:hypothetical protein
MASCTGLKQYGQELSCGNAGPRRGRENALRHSGQATTAAEFSSDWPGIAGIQIGAA